MPGPRNAKKKKQARNKKEKRSKVTPDASASRTSPPIHPSDGLALPAERVRSPAILPTSSELEPPQIHKPLPREPPPFVHPDEDFGPLGLLQRPMIEDPGNGPRVRDIRAFLSSSFAAAPLLDDPLCAEFAQEEVLEMLFTVLPEETAMILWYNKSRSKSRICPVCQRLYRLGDFLHEALVIERGDREHEQGNALEKPDSKHISPYRFREQNISGLCSPTCFIFAAIKHPAAIRSTWGRMAEELSDEVWSALDGPPELMGYGNDMGLGMLVKMTRCHDLGLGQLFFPGENLDEEYENEHYEDAVDDRPRPPRSNQVAY